MLPDLGKLSAITQHDASNGGHPSSGRTDYSTPFSHFYNNLLRPVTLIIVLRQCCDIAASQQAYHCRPHRQSVDLHPNRTQYHNPHALRPSPPSTPPTSPPHHWTLSFCSRHLHVDTRYHHHGTEMTTNPSALVPAVSSLVVVRLLLAVWVAVTAVRLWATAAWRTV